MEPVPTVEAAVIEQAQIMTVLLYNVNPFINKEATMDIMIRALSEGMSIQEAAHYGFMIRQTIGSPESHAAH